MRAVNASVDMTNFESTKVTCKYTARCLPTSLLKLTKKNRCGGGNHFITHEEVDAMISGMRPTGPDVQSVNAPGCPSVAPPLGEGLDQVFHWDPVKRISSEKDPMPYKADGTPHDFSDCGTFRGFGHEPQYFQYQPSLAASDPMGPGGGPTSYGYGPLI